MDARAQAGFHGEACLEGDALSRSTVGSLIRLESPASITSGSTQTEGTTKNQMTTNRSRQGGTVTSRETPDRRRQREGAATSRPPAARRRKRPMPNMYNLDDWVIKTSGVGSGDVGDTQAGWGDTGMQGHRQGLGNHGSGGVLGVQNREGENQLNKLRSEGMDLVGGDGEESPQLNKPGEETTKPERGSGDVRGRGCSWRNKPRGMGVVRDRQKPARTCRSSRTPRVVASERKAKGRHSNITSDPERVSDDGG